MRDDEKISEAIVTLLEANVGYGIEIFGEMLLLHQLEDLTFVVHHERYDPETDEFEFDFEEIFSDAKAAAEFFLKKRREYQLGYDFETASE